ncbi:MAG: tetratricopeptide repeat protein [Pseudomonadota bacterium]
MDRVPNINLDRPRHKPKNPFVSFLIYLGAFFLLLLCADYLLVKKNIFKNVNPITQMQEYYKDKKYSRVIESGKALLRRHPNSMIIRRYLWKSYAYTKQYGSAVRTIGEMQNYVGQEMESSLAFCTTYRLMGEYEKMHYYCQKVLEIKPNNEPAQDQMVQALIEQRKYDEAIKYLDALSRRQPDNLKRLMLRSSLATLKGEYNKSIQILEKVRSEYPEAATVYYYLGENYFFMGDYIKAAGFLEEFTDSVYKKDVDIELLENAYTSLALSYERAKMYSNAYRAYKNAACFTIKLKKTNETIRLMTKAITLTYAGYKGFVSQNDFKKKFRNLEKELENKCDEKLFMGGNS